VNSSMLLYIYKATRQIMIINDRGLTVIVLVFLYILFCTDISEKPLSNTNSATVKNSTISPQNDTTEVSQRPESMVNNILVNTADVPDAGTTVLAIAAGSLLVLIAVMLSVLCVIIWRRRKDQSGGYTTSDQLINSNLGKQRPESCLIRNRFLDELTHHTGELESDFLCGSKEKIVLKPVTSGCLLTSGYSINTLPQCGTCSFNDQHQDWDQLMEIRNLCYDDMVVQSVSNVYDLPVYDLSRDTCSVKTQIVSDTKVNTCAGANHKHPLTGIFVDPILDGYVGGEHVDDDIDHVDFTIRIPSVCNEMCSM